MYALESPVLSVAIDAFSQVQGEDALSELITLFSKCKESLQDGERLENMCWRLWYREHLSHSSIAASVPTSNLTSVALLEQDEKDNSDDEYTDVTSDEEVGDRRHSSFEEASVRDHPVGGLASGSSQLPPTRPQPPRHFSERLPARSATSQSSQLVRNHSSISHPLERNRTSLTDDGNLHRWSMVSSNNSHQSSQYIRRSQSALTAGKIMADLLPDKLVVSKTPPGGLSSERSLSREALSISTDTSTTTLGPDSASHNVQGERRQQCHLQSELCLPHESQPHVVVTPDAVIASPHTPPSRFPKVVILNPTPHTTPPMTPRAESDSPDHNRRTLTVPSVMSSPGSHSEPILAPEDMSSASSISVMLPGSLESSSSGSSKTNTMPPTSPTPSATTAATEPIMAPLPHSVEPRFFVSKSAGSTSSQSPESGSSRVLSEFARSREVQSNVLGAKSSGAENGGGAISMAAIAEEIAISGHPHLSTAHDSTTKVMDSRQVQQMMQHCVEGSTNQPSGSQQQQQPQPRHRQELPHAQSTQHNALPSSLSSNVSQTKSVASAGSGAPSRRGQGKMGLSARRVSSRTGKGKAVTPLTGLRGLGSRPGLSRTQSHNQVSAIAPLTPLRATAEQRVDDSQQLKSIAGAAPTASGSKMAPKVSQPVGRSRSMSEVAAMVAAQVVAEVAADNQHGATASSSSKKGKQPVVAVGSKKKAPSIRSAKSPSHRQATQTASASQQRARAPQRPQQVVEVDDSSDYETIDGSDEEDEDEEDEEDWSDESEDDVEQGEGAGAGSAAVRNEAASNGNTSLQTRGQARHPDNQVPRQQPHEQHHQQPHHQEQQHHQQQHQRSRQHHSHAHRAQIQSARALPPQDVHVAVLEAQRQTEMFVKLDRRSYTDLSTRPRSGLLTSIFHPDPELFPEGHPYKYSRSTHDILAAPIRGIYANPSPALVGNAQVPHQPQPEAQLGGIQQQLQRQRQQQLQLLQQQELQLQAQQQQQQQQQLQAQQQQQHQQAQHQPRPQQPRRNLLNGLQMSRASAAGPVAANVTAQGSSVIVSPTMQVPGNPTQRSNLRLKGRPDNEDLEESSGEEDNENRLPMASSLAMQKLAAFTERQQQSRQNRQQQQAQAQDQAPQQRSQMTRAHTAIGTTSQLPTPPVPEEELIPSQSMAAASAPIPFLYPYDQMPVPMPVLSPRRNRLTMLSNELPESLRRNLLWERQVNKHRPMGGAMRTHGGLGGGGRVAPDTSLGPTTAENYEERLRIAKARNKSWANEFHGAGW